MTYPLNTPPPARKRRIRPVVTIGACLVAVLACVLGVAVLANVSDALVDQQPTVQRHSAVTGAATAATPVSPPAAAETLRPADVKISLKTIGKECYGSAGCNLDVRPVLDWPGELSEVWDVTYVITYQEWSLPDGSYEAVPVDGEEIGTAQIRGSGDDYTFTEHHLMVFDRKTKPVIKIDQLERRG